MAAQPANQVSSGAPLAGRSVVVTRTDEQSRALAAPLEALGAEVVACPVIAIVDPADLAPMSRAIDGLATYDWVVFTSANTVDRFLGRLLINDPTAEALTHVQIAAVGSATARRLGRFGVEPDLVPEDFRAEGLVDEFVAMGAGPGWRILLPRALEAREILPETLRDLGAEVDVVAVYQTVPAEPDPATVERLRAGGFDAVTFTSPSTVRNFVALLSAAGLEVPDVMGGVVKASIGPVTTDALAAAGFSADVEAQPSTVERLVDVLAERLAGC